MKSLKAKTSRGLMASRKIVQKAIKTKGLTTEQVVRSFEEVKNGKQ